MTNRPSIDSDTICALATAPGGALGIIRISGPQAFSAVSALCPLCCETIAANTVHYTHIVAPTVSKDIPAQTVPYVAIPSQQNIIDEALVTIFRSPHSYTGENSVEISCHGSSYILNKVLELLVQQGCRMARPGEFTQRAYLNRKMDLSQAEAVADLIASSNKATHDIAMSQLRGHFSSELARLREQLLKLTSLLELELDFSDHEDLEFADRTELFSLAQEIDSRVMHLARSFETGQALKQGIPVAIVGKTNVGKSTLLNQLVGDDRAIVSNIHGTTRDTIEETMEINGVQFRFIDTAGLRQTSDEIEQIGIGRTYAAIQKARIVLWLIDAEPTQDELQEIHEKCNNKSLIIIQNKIDKQEKSSANKLFSRLSPLTSHLLSISAKFGTNLGDLETAICEAADIPSLQESDVIVTNARHYDALTRAHAHLQRVLEGLHNQLSGDLLSEDLCLTLDTLAEITGGQITPNEVLGNIFSHFCVGK